MQNLYWVSYSNSYTLGAHLRLNASIWHLFLHPSDDITMPKTSKLCSKSQYIISDDTVRITELLDATVRPVTKAMQSVMCSSVCMIKLCSHEYGIHWSKFLATNIFLMEHIWNSLSPRASRRHHKCTFRTSLPIAYLHYCTDALADCSIAPTHLLPAPLHRRIGWLQHEAPCDVLSPFGLMGT